MASLKSDGKMVFMIFVGAIITVVFLGAIANAVFNQTTFVTATNFTVTTAAINGTVTLPGRANTTAITVVNATDGTDWTANFSVNTTDAAGVLGVFLVSTDDGGAVGQAEASANVTYTYKPQGYIEESAGRSVTTLIVLFGALAILVFIVVSIYKFGSLREMMNSFGRRRSR